MEYTASRRRSLRLSCKPSRCGAVPLVLLILLMVPKLLSASLEQQQREWPPSDLDAVLDVAHAVRALGLKRPRGNERGLSLHRVWSLLVKLPVQRHAPHSRLLAEQAADQIATSYAHGPLAESMAQAPRATSVRVGRRLWLELATHLRTSGLQRSVEWHLRDELFKVAAERLDGVSGIAEVESQLCIPGIGGERDTISGLGIDEATGGLAIRRPSVAIGLAQVELR